MKAILDTNVFIRGKSIPEFNSYYTVEGVMAEVKSDSAKLKFNTSKIQVQKPSKESIREVRTVSRDIGAETSDTDENLVALANDLGGVLVSDDKGVQNLAAHLDVRYQSYMGEEIESKMEWVKICSNCGAEVEGDVCSRCGSTQVDRKPDRYNSE